MPGATRTGFPARAEVIFLLQSGSGGTTFVYADNDGDKLADLEIKLTGLRVLGPGDLLF